MPEIIKNYSPPKKGVGQPPKYPWDEWFTGIIHKTNKAENKSMKFSAKTDFTCTIKTMVRAMKKEATKRGVRLSIFREDDGIVVMYVGMLPS